MGRERRQFERVESLISIKYVAPADKISGNSLTQDVSAGGVGLPVNGKISAGTGLDIVITLPDDRQATIPAKAKVAWAKRNFEHWKPKYSSGLKFVSISPSDRDKLLAYAAKHRWVKSDFERALEADRVSVLGIKEEGLIGQVRQE